MGKTGSRRECRLGKSDREEGQMLEEPETNEKRESTVGGMGDKPKCLTDCRPTAGAAEGRTTRRYRPGLDRRGHVRLGVSAKEGKDGGNSSPQQIAGARFAAAAPSG